MLRRSYHLGVRTYRIREAVVLYIGLEAEDERVASRREEGRGNERENRSSIAYTYEGKLPPILDKLSTILEECRREVTPRRAFVSSKTDNLPGIKGNCAPV